MRIGLGLAFLGFIISASSTFAEEKPTSYYCKTEQTQVWRDGRLEASAFSDVAGIDGAYDFAFIEELPGQFRLEVGGVNIDDEKILVPKEEYAVVQNANESQPLILIPLYASVDAEATNRSVIQIKEYTPQSFNESSSQPKPVTHSFVYYDAGAGLTIFSGKCRTEVGTYGN